MARATPPSSKGLLYNLKAPTRTRTLIPALTYHRTVKVAPGANLSLTAVLRARARFGARFGARLIARFGAQVRQFVMERVGVPCAGSGG